MSVINQVITDRYALYHGDCVEVLGRIPSSSVHLSVYSPPFCGLFQYSSSDRDLSNAKSYPEFLAHYEIVIREIARVTMPGRLSCVHCMDVPSDGANICGYIDFPGDIIRLHQKYGFEMLPRISIWKEPLRVRNRTMIKSLTHRQVVEDSTLVNVAAADYLIPFRKRGTNPIPVVHPLGLDRYAGETEVPRELWQYRNWQGNQIQNRYSHWIWRRYASSNWDDVRVDRVLPYKQARDGDDEKHVHPLQLDVIERTVVLYSNPDEVVLTPFGGVGSEPYGAIINGRRAIAVELKETYFNQMVRNLEDGKVENDGGETLDTQASIFDLIDASEIVPNSSLVGPKAIEPLPNQMDLFGVEA